MPGQHLPDLTGFPGDISADLLLMYLVDVNDTNLDPAGSGYKLPVRENLVVTDGANSVVINGGGVINLAGGTFNYNASTGGDVVTTQGEQTIFNKTYDINWTQVGPIMNIRDDDFLLWLNSDQNVYAGFDLSLLDSAAGYQYQLPNNDGLSELADLETAQTFINKTLTEPVINIIDSELTLRDSTGSSRTAKFEVGGVASEDFVFLLPTPTDLSSTLVDTEDTQTLANKTLTAPVIVDFTNALHDHRDNNDGGKLDHGLALTGLGDDDHTQYYNQTRGDARYYTKTDLNTSGQEGSVHWNNVDSKPSTYPPEGHTHNQVMDRIAWKNSVAIPKGTAITYTMPSTAAGGTVNFEWFCSTVGDGATGSIAFAYGESIVTLQLYAYDGPNDYAVNVGNIQYSGSTHKVTVVAGNSYDINDFTSDIILINK